MMSRFMLVSLVAMFCIALNAQAKEYKIGYIDSEAILSQYDAYQEAQRKLQEEEQKYIAEAQAKEEIVRQMEDEVKQQSLMLSAEARAERELRLSEKKKDLEQYRLSTWGEGGKLFTKNLELSRPILEKINAAIEKVSRADGYDMVFDAAAGNIDFALPEHDLTETVIEELGRN